VISVYLLRHGDAESRRDWKGADAERPLTERGRETTAREAVRIRELDLKLDAIVTSPLRRARETAEIVAKAIGADKLLVEDERLAPGFDARQLAKVVRAHGAAGGLMIVGHEPDFSSTIGELTGGRVVCKKGGLARVDVADQSLAGAELVWLAPPALLVR
jgi:phosphohistidine phosphatase